MPAAEPLEQLEPLRPAEQHVLRDRIERLGLADHPAVGVDDMPARLVQRAHVVDRVRASDRVVLPMPAAVLISLIVLAVTAAAQAVVVVLSGSVALLGDTLHNVADALTAVPLLIAFRLARRPASKRFTYGYGRAEDLAGLFVIAMITLSAGLAAYEAINRLIHPRTVSDLRLVAAAAVIGFLGNELVARYRVTVGRRIGSTALIADGLHPRTDGFTSLAVLLGALGVGLGWRQADPIIGLLITVAILTVLRSATRQVGARLMDAVDPDLVDQATAAVTSVPGINHIQELRIRWIGHTLRAEVESRWRSS